MVRHQLLEDFEITDNKRKLYCTIAKMRSATEQIQHLATQSNSEDTNK